MSFQGNVMGLISSVGAAAGTVKGIQAANALIQKQEQAQAKTKQVQKAKTKQRRNFMEYLSKMPTNWGGTVGDLAPDLQKKIAQNFNKNQRKTIMNRMDREAGDKK